MFVGGRAVEAVEGQFGGRSGGGWEAVGREEGAQVWPKNPGSVDKATETTHGETSAAPGEKGTGVGRLKPHPPDRLIP